MTNQTILGFELRETCGACPEQYDVYRDGEKVAYLRLRHGAFRADVPNSGGTTVYYSDAVEGDGAFKDHERDRFLHLACEAIWNHYSRRQIPLENEFSCTPTISRRGDTIELVFDSCEEADREFERVVELYRVVDWSPEDREVDDAE